MKLKIPKYSTDDWENISSYGHGYAIGRQGLEFWSQALWGDDEVGHLFESQGWTDGFGDYALFGVMSGKKEKL